MGFKKAADVMNRFARACDVLWVSEHGTATLAVGKRVPGTDEVALGVWPLVSVDRAPYGKPGYRVSVSWASNGENDPDQTATFIRRLQHAQHCAACVQAALDGEPEPDSPWIAPEPCPESEGA